MLTPEEMQEFERELQTRKERILQNLEAAQKKITMMQNRNPRTRGTTRFSPSRPISTAGSSSSSGPNSTRSRSLWVK